MKRLKSIKETLIGVVEGQLSHLDCVDAEELGEVVDMIKDLDEAMYYCSIVKAMEEAEKDDKIEELAMLKHAHMMACNERDMDRDMGRMYFTEPYYRNTPSKDDWRDTDRRRNEPYMDGERSRSTEREMPTSMRDTREGRSPMSRRMYMESKELHKDKASKIKDLETYMKELAEDIIEMIEDASPEERQVLEKKMTQLTSKVSQLNV